MQTHIKASGIFCILAVFLGCLALSSCGRSPSSTKRDEVVAYVDNEPVFASDLKRGMARKARQDPLLITTPDIEQDQLDMMIDQRLIIQEAFRKGLAQQDSFVQTIKTFWEQTLIREFIEYKKKEFQNYLYVNDNEIRKYYEFLATQVTFKVLKSRDKRHIDVVYNEMKGNKPVESNEWETVGPVGYDDIASNILYEAFTLPEGQVKRMEEAPYYYLIEVVHRQGIARQPLEALRPQIEKQIRAAKEQRLFDEWLTRERQKAKVKITKH